MNKQDKLAEVRTRFLADLRSSGQHIGELKQQGGVIENEALHELIHRIAGKAGFFGEVEIAETAKNLEKDLRLQQLDKLVANEKLDELLSLIRQVTNAKN